MAHEPYAILRNSDFRLLVAARVFITVGLQIQSIAVGWQIYSLTKDPLYLGLAGLAEALPAIGVALYAGHVADILDRKTIAVRTVLAIVVSIAGLAAASMYMHPDRNLVLAIYLLVAFSGFARGFYGPSIFGLISQIVPREQFANASAWNSAVWQTSAILGPIIGGWMYLHVQAPMTYAGSAALLCCALFILSLIKSKTDLSKSVANVPAMESIKEGLRFVFSNQIVLGAMTLDLFGVLFGGAVALLPIFAADIFKMGPEALGVLRAAPSIGAVLTASILAHYPIRSHAGWTFLFVVAGFGLCMIGFGASTNFYLSVGLLALSGMFDGVSVYLRGTIYQLTTPETMKGRVAAVNSIFIGSSNEIGEFESGIMAKLMGTVPSVIFGGCMTLLVVLITAWRAPKLRDLNIWHLEKSPESVS